MEVVQRLLFKLFPTQISRCLIFKIYRNYTEVLLRHLIKLFRLKLTMLIEFSGSRSACFARERDLQRAGAQCEWDLLHATGPRASEEQDLQTPGNAVPGEPANGAGSSPWSTGYLLQSQASLTDDLLHRALDLSDIRDRYPRGQSTPLPVPDRLLWYRSLERDVPIATDRRESSVATVGVSCLLDISQLLRHGSLQSVVQALPVRKKASGQY